MARTVDPNYRDCRPLSRLSWSFLLRLCARLRWAGHGHHAHLAPIRESRRDVLGCVLRLTKKIQVTDEQDHSHFGSLPIRRDKKKIDDPLAPGATRLCISSLRDPAGRGDQSGCASPNSGDQLRQSRLMDANCLSSTIQRKQIPYSIAQGMLHQP